MIQVALEPAQLVVNQPNELAIRFTNSGSGICTNIVFRLKLPVQLVLMRGHNHIHIDRLEAGRSFIHTVRIRPEQVGLWEVTSVNFSYRDSQGQSQRVTDLKLKIQVTPPVLASFKPKPKKTEATTPIRDAEPIYQTRVSSNFSRLSSPLSVFLCHCSEDKSVVRKLYQRLCAEGFDPWIDEEKLLPGQEWQSEIRKAVRAADVFLACLSRNFSKKAGHLQKEINYALDVADEQPEDAIFIIPLKLEECEVPERLRRWQWVSLFEEKGVDRLLQALRAQAAVKADQSKL